MLPSGGRSRYRLRRASQRDAQRGRPARRGKGVQERERLGLDIVWLGNRRLGHHVPVRQCVQCLAADARKRSRAITPKSENRANISGEIGDGPKSARELNALPGMWTRKRRRRSVLRELRAGNSRAGVSDAADSPSPRTVHRRIRAGGGAGFVRRRESPSANGLRCAGGGRRAGAGGRLSR